MNTLLPNKMVDTIKKGNPLCFGLFQNKDGFHFSVNLNSKMSCGIFLWKKSDIIDNEYAISTSTAKKIIFSNEIRIGNVFSGLVSEFLIEEYAYCYFCDGSLISDTYGRAFMPPCICDIEEKKEKKIILLAYTLNQEFNWDEDTSPNNSYEDSVIYGIHVKGFTKHNSSQVINKGTYQGILEKLDYIKSLGITTIELMPSYEFVSDEILTEEDRRTAYSYKEEIPNKKEESKRINYWGYKKGYYFSPKASYSANENASYEMKELVKELHKNKIEIIMQFFFPENYYFRIILDALQFWVMEYHIDGFRLIGANIPKEYLARDGILSNTKLIFDSLNEKEERRIEEANMSGHTAILANDFSKDIRKFLKGDENNIHSFMEHMYQQAKLGGSIHTITDYCGFTLHDLVSYDRKHNEANGENNKDGIDFNYSWNCGEEGPTKKRKINSLRKKQMKNALCMLLLSQATPYLRGGDEFAFSQRGNNNPFCQDNEISWLDWSLSKKNKDQLMFVKDLIQFRQDHPVLHMKKRIRVMDYLGCGYPDVSFHGEEAWRPVLDNVSRHVGIMYCGKYATKPNSMEDNFIYITYNMHWVEHSFALPRLPEGKVWKNVFYTKNIDKKENTSIRKKENRNREFVSIESRSVSVFVSEER